MVSDKSNRTDAEQLIRLLGEAHKLFVQVRPTPNVSNSIDITAVNPNDEVLPSNQQEYRYTLDDRPDPLRIPEIMIIICVLLLWLGSIFVFIRHSELLRIRHRDIPYRLAGKLPMNLNHITVVHRTSDMVIHSRPRLSTTGTLPAPVYNQSFDEFSNSNTTTPLNPHFYPKGRPRGSTISTCSATKYPCRNDQLLNPHMIPSNVRRSLLDLHRKSVDNLSGVRYSISYSTNDVFQRKPSDDDNVTGEERCIQESPV